jgi:hypothetical protein
MVVRVPVLARRLFPVADRVRKKGQSDRVDKLEELHRLFKETQALPQTKNIPDDMIAKEIEKIRNK